MAKNSDCVVLSGQQFTQGIRLGSGLDDGYVEYVQIQRVTDGAWFWSFKIRSRYYGMAVYVLFGASSDLNVYYTTTPSDYSSWKKMT